MSSIECIVLDMGGTLTEIEAEAVPYVEAFRTGLAAQIGPESDEWWQEAERAIAADPDRYGWEYDGLIVAPAHADPYVRCIAIGTQVLDRAGLTIGRRNEILEQLYRRAYPLSTTVFRRDAKQVVEALIATHIPIYMVSNGGINQVREKLDELDPYRKQEVSLRGGARKFAVHEIDRPHPYFDRLPAQMTCSGLTRPIYLRRGYYFEVLRRIWDETGASPETTVVCGDIFELDLAMPAKLGARVHMVARPNTPDYERRAVRALPGGSFSVDLTGLLAQLELFG